MILDSKKRYERWDIIISLAKENSCRKLAEVGVQEGENARRILLQSPTFNLEHLFLIDPYIYLPFFSWVFINRYPASFLKMTSVEAAKMFKDNALDLIFIDADHKYESVKEDIIAWLPKVRKGGILSGHDYDGEDNMHPGVKQAVDEIFGKKVNSVPVTRVKVWWVKL